MAYPIVSRQIIRILIISLPRAAGEDPIVGTGQAFPFMETTDTIFMAAVPDHATGQLAVKERDPHERCRSEPG
jgi:hypothetical protein